MVVEMVGPEEVVSLSQQIAKAASEPMLRFTIQPGKYKYPNRKRLSTGKVKMGKRVFIPSPIFPAGITLSFPAWFVATVGLAMILHLVGSLEKLARGEKLTEDEQAGLLGANVLDFWQASSPLGIISKWAGV